MQLIASLTLLVLIAGWTSPSAEAGPLPPGPDPIPLYLTAYGNPTCGGVPIQEQSIPISNFCLPLNNPTIIISGPRTSATGFRSIFVTCRKGGAIRTYATADCTGPVMKVMKSVKRNIAAYCIGDETNSIRLSCRPPAADCGPSLSLNKRACDKKIRKCGSASGGGLKWVGRGCRSENEDRSQDGGCQCRGFCGYGCEGKCRADSECAWNATLSACTVKGATDVPAGPITNCNPPPAPPRGSSATASSLLDTLFGDLGA
jgi:hypothetical protein